MLIAPTTHVISVSLIVVDDRDALDVDSFSASCATYRIRLNQTNQIGMRTKREKHVTRKARAEKVRQDLKRSTLKLKSIKESTPITTPKSAHRMLQSLSRFDPTERKIRNRIIDKNSHSRESTHAESPFTTTLTTSMVRHPRRSSVPVQSSRLKNPLDNQWIALRAPMIMTRAIISVNEPPMAKTAIAISVCKSCVRKE